MYKYVATCSFGTEPLLVKELELFEVENVKPLTGAVEFSANIEQAYKLCLWSRVADRVLLFINDFKCSNADDIYHNALKINWQNYMDVENTFQIKGSIAKEVNLNSQYALFRMKDAIVDWFQSSYSRRPSIARKNSDLYFNFHINKDYICSLYFDLVGEPLYKRGYRVSKTDAILKETLANAIVQYGKWQVGNKNSLLVDPMCGSGTLLIEAAILSLNIAPGAYRQSFSLEKWQGHDAEIWSRVRTEADNSKLFVNKDHNVKFFGYDSSKENIKKAISNARNSGLENLIHFEKRNLYQFSLPDENKLSPESCFLITNPPYGERLGEAESLKYLYKCLGRKIKANCNQWQVSIFSNNIELLDQINIPVVSRTKLFNGPLKCQLVNFDTSSAFSTQKIKLDFEKKNAIDNFSNNEISVDFSNRISKNYKSLKKWISSNNIENYRLYDRDMPEFNLVVDIYGDKIHLQEYKAPKSIDSEAARKRLNQAILTLVKVFDINRRQIHIKKRERQKGTNQYRQINTKRNYNEITENNLKFLVNFTDYLDVGIFLDHRYIRSYIRNISRGKNFLNLFSYTATASVYAAAGGALSTTSIDLSSAYTAWAKKNFLLNGFDLEENTLIIEDSLTWLEDDKNPVHNYDIIFVDPPTYSNSKKLTTDFNIQRDHLK